jgi:monovalent cation/proton antiporter MnhG/PhaG subunit
VIVRQVAVNVFLWLGVALVLISCLGVLLFGSVYDRLHFSAPAVLGSICIAIAVVIHEDFSLIGDKAILIAAFLLIASPVLGHATGRSARQAERGDWQIGADEKIEVEEK